MVVLSKVNGNSILENLVASIIVLIVFSIAGTSINNIFKNNVSRRDFKFDNKVKEIEYLMINNQMKLPYEYEQDVKKATFSRSEEMLEITTLKKGLIIKKITCCLD